MEWLEALIVYEDEWSDVRYLKQITVLLKGRVKIWCRAREGDEIKTVSDFKTRFKSRYCNQKEENAEALNLMRILSEGPHKSLSDWILLIEWKNKVADFDQEMFRSVIFNQINKRHHGLFDSCRNLLEMADKAEENGVKSIKEIQKKTQQRYEPRTKTSNQKEADFQIKNDWKKIRDIRTRSQRNVTNAEANITDQVVQISRKKMTRNVRYDNPKHS
ncbi:hypothetical protein ECANGB1_1827 [Enterospora canceri]|uniref:Retrotransposon gag domain-containing protein n=1 Tax=Enterospora canceri TaxID=1081671 RepID=A0A1Y1S6K6_9MICR|nr:hypothetical protein ECANGB1_1827 [Enterospora canceri]